MAVSQASAPFVYALLNMPEYQVHRVGLASALEGLRRSHAVLGTAVGAGKRELGVRCADRRCGRQAVSSSAFKKAHLRSLNHRRFLKNAQENLMNFRQNYFSGGGGDGF